MSALGVSMNMKPGSVGSPKRYLGTDIKKRVDYDNGDGYWTFGSNTYLKEALRIVRDVLETSELKGRGKGTQPYSILTYRPELDITLFSDPDQYILFMMIVEMMIWLIELGRKYILLETSQLSNYLASPRIGHLMQALHVFHYLLKHDSSWIPMDHIPLNIEYTGPQDVSPEARRKVMRRIYRDVRKKIANNVPKIRGKEVLLNVYVDADHAGNKVTRRYQTGILVFLTKALIVFDCKRQNTMDSLTFGSEYIALKLAMEKIIGLKYKLRMMSVEINGSASLFFVIKISGEERSQS